MKEVEILTFGMDFYRLQTTGQACRRLVYLSAAEALFWLFITSRRLSRCAEVWRKSVRGLGGSGLGGRSTGGGVVSDATPDWAGAGAGFAGVASAGCGMGSTQTLTLGALSLEPAGLPLPRLGSTRADGADGAGSDGADEAA